MARLAALAIVVLALAAPQAEGQAATCVAFLPKSKSFIYGTLDGQVAVSGPNGRILHQSNGSIAALAVSQDGRKVAFCVHAPVDGSSSGFIVVCDIERARALVTIPQRAGSIAMSPDGKRFATAGGSFVWPVLRDAATGKQIETLQSDSLGHFVAFSPEGARVVAGDDSNIGFYDASTGKPIRQIGWLPNCTWSLIFSADGRRIATVERPTQSISEGLVSKVWEVASGRAIFSTTCKASAAHGTVINPSGRLVAFAEGASITLWDIAQNEGLERFKCEGSIHALAVSDDGKLLASAGADGVKLWNMPQEKPIEQGDAHALLSDLSSRDARAATRAVFGLAADSNKSLPLLRESLKPARPLPEATLARLLDELGGDSFAVRQKATVELQKLEQLAAPALKDLLASRPPLEVHRRAEELLAQLEEPKLSPEVLRSLRAVEVLERIDTPESRKLLEEVAAGHPEARLTQEANRALARLQRGK